MQAKPSIVTYLDTRRKKKSGRYPVKLRITFLKEQKYYPIGIDLTPEEFSDMNSIRIPEIAKQIPIKLRRELQDYNFKCEGQTAKAKEIISKLPFFNFSVFKRKFLTGQYSTGSVFLYYENTIKKLKEEGRVGTASNYSTSMNSLKQFKPKLLFRDITVELLQQYESWMISKERSITTVGIYLRTLRAVLNQAIEDGEFPRDLYPFKKRRYQIPASRNIKKALTLDEIGKIVKFQAPFGSWLEKARDMFVFSYFANGINMKDILRLKYANIDGEYIRFIRAKTNRTNRSNSVPITFHLSEELRDIIRRLGNPDRDSRNYIFPVLKDATSPTKEMADVQQFTQMVNKYLKKIGLEVGIGKKVTTYFARHSFATILKKSGVSPHFISESLGHASLKTTESYLDSFENSQRKEILQNLRGFKSFDKD